jgi:hypothetical protein
MSARLGVILSYVLKLTLWGAAGLLVWGAVAQQAPPKQSDPQSQKGAPATSGARELFYLAVAPKDKLPQVSTATAHTTKNNAGATTTTVAYAGPPPAPALHLGLRYNLLLVDDNNRGTSVPADRVFRAGERVAIEVEVNHSGYLYVLAKQSSGQWMPLLPSPEMSDENNIIDPGHKVRVPENYYFEIQDPPGAEHLVMVFSRDPQDFYELYQGIKNQNTAPSKAPVRRPNPAGVLMADASNVNDAIHKMQEQFGTRDIAIRRVSQPTSSNEPAGSVYVVNASDKPSSSVVTELDIKHR